MRRARRSQRPGGRPHEVALVFAPGSVWRGREGCRRAAASSTRWRCPRRRTGDETTHPCRAGGEASSGTTASPTPGREAARSLDSIVGHRASRGTLPTPHRQYTVAAQRAYASALRLVGERLKGLDHGEEFPPTATPPPSPPSRRRAANRAPPVRAGRREAARLWLLRHRTPRRGRPTRRIFAPRATEGWRTVLERTPAPGGPGTPLGLLRTRARRSNAAPSACGPTRAVRSRSDSRSAAAERRRRRCCAPAGDCERRAVAQRACELALRALVVTRAATARATPTAARGSAARGQKRPGCSAPPRGLGRRVLASCGDRLAVRRLPPVGRFASYRRARPARRGSRRARARRRRRRRFSFRTRRRRSARTHVSLGSFSASACEGATVASGGARARRLRGRARRIARSTRRVHRASAQFSRRRARPRLRLMSGMMLDMMCDVCTDA